MRNMKTKVVLATLAAVAAMIGLGATFSGGNLPKVHAQEEALEACSAATLNGTYVITFSGLFTRGPVPAGINNFTPVAGIGLVTFDGDGNLSDLGSASVGGQIVPVNVTGTYTVNSDCTGTFATPNAHLNLVILRKGREIRALNTGLGNVVFDNFVKQ
jgi:hypothetical protein